MPITDERVLDLLSAGEDYKRGLERLRDLLSQEWEKAEGGVLTHEDALRNVFVMSSELSLLEEPQTSPGVLVRERAHYANWRLNANRRRRAKRLRLSGQQEEGE